ncbi:BEN domain-containing protein 2 isoform X2 [Ornithorhynchus anatinus]|uniref:BEN domain-containing protein 2 isoform X2 n=1 Tax=Ornithorhynchus anatinus TaxID=9258 RepID=UPI0019D46D7A|nr:BEN domain-containing protein 2 isoform X2 [Ornithorhynchus anatinus]
MSGEEGTLPSPPFPRPTPSFAPRPTAKTLRRRSQRPSRNEYVTVNVEDEVEAVIIENSENEDAEDGLSASGMLAIEPNSQGSSNNHHYISQLSYGSEGLPVVSDQGVSNPSAGQRDAEEMEFIFLHKRRRLASSQGNSTVRGRDYEDAGSVVYEYEPDYECGSVVSEASYTGDQQKTLMEVLNYCQVMYDAIQKLDKKFDLLQGKVSEMQRTRVKPLLLKPRPVGFTYRSSNPIPHGKIRVQKPMARESSLPLAPPEQGSHGLPRTLGPQKNHVQTNSTGKPVQPAQAPEAQPPALRQSPPLPTIVSTHSLQPPYVAVSGIPDLPTPPNLVNLVMESAGKTASSAMSSPLVSSVMPTQPETSLGRNAIMINCLPSPGSASVAKEMPSSSVCINPSFEYVGDPKRNVKVLGTYLMKARQKTKPKYAARYLVRVLFPKETLLCSVMGVSARGRRTLDPNKVAAIREFLATFFPNYDLSEYGRDWKTCITNVNAMIRCLCCETKIRTEKGEGRDKAGDIPDPPICVDLSYNEEDGEVSSQSASKTTAAAKATLRNAAWDGNAFPEVFQPPPSNKMQSLEPMELLGNPWRNVQLPFSVIYVAKGKSRPELSARYLIRHLFTEEVLVKSNVYGNLERGMCPLDCNRINALRGVFSLPGSKQRFIWRELEKQTHRIAFPSWSDLCLNAFEWYLSAYYLC